MVFQKKVEEKVIPQPQQNPQEFQQPQQLPMQQMSPMPSFPQYPFSEQQQIQQPQRSGYPMPMQQNVGAYYPQAMPQQQPNITDIISIILNLRKEELQYLIEELIEREKITIAQHIIAIK